MITACPYYNTFRVIPASPDISRLYHLLPCGDLIIAFSSV